MIVLDTDHLSLLGREQGLLGHRLRSRLVAAGFTKLTTTIITFEEQSRGWLAHLAGIQSAERMIDGYAKLSRHLDDFSRMEVLEFDRAAAEIYFDLKAARIRVGSMDLKIAAIALSRDATLLSRNLGDFRKVPGLKVEDWCV